MAAALRRNEFIGTRFGRLTVTRFIKSSNHHTYWETKCDCGNIKINTKQSLTRKAVYSCGCLRKDKLIKRITKHGMAESPIYKVWFAMHQRCYNTRCKAYKNYGARGIFVSEEWSTFKGFYETFGKNKPFEKASINRKNNNGPYSLKNCEWTTQKKQNYNKTNTKIVEYNGQKMCLAELTDKLGVCDSTVRSRLKLGWILQQAVESPKYSRRTK